MPIYPENFVANSLSGTILVTNGFANVTLPTNPFALEGDKNFVIRIRKGGINGLVIATSPTITVRDPSQLVSLTANVSTVAEGNLVSFTLVTANAANNSNVFYSILPVTANVNTADFVGANVGRATIINNQATFSYFANADYSLVDETGETFRVQLRENNPTGNIIFTTSNVAITDFYKRINVFGFTESSRSIVEGTSVTFTVFAQNLSSGTLLYYYTSGNADISGSNTGSIAMNSVSNTITISTSPTVPTGESRSLNLILSETNLGTPIATSNAITVIDSSLAYLNATGGTVTTIDGFRIHTFTSSNTFTVSNFATAAFNTANVLVVAGGGGGGGRPDNSQAGAGGGAGGFISQSSISLASSNSYSITVGAGGAGNPPNGNSTAGSNGSNSIISGSGFTTITAVGGGGAGYVDANGRPGGSGGGGLFGGSGFGFPGPTQQGFPGADRASFFWAGGGGASQAGVGGNPPGSGGNPAPSYRPGKGGDGAPSTITGSNVIYAGGGGAGTPGPNDAGAGGGGVSGFHILNNPPGSVSPSLINANVNTGGGGGGSGSPPATLTGSGGSGIVIIRYPWVPPAAYVSVTANSSGIFHGDNAFFVVNTTFANNSILYYDTLGNVNSSSFVGGNTGSFTVTGNATVVRLQTVRNIPQDQERMFALRIREDSATTGNIRLVSSNVFVYDSNVGLYIAATGGNVFTSGGFRTHIFTTSTNFAVTTAGRTGGSIEYFMVAGGGAGGQASGGGGGAGGVLFGSSSVVANTYTVTVGAGGTGIDGSNAGLSGSNTSVRGATTIGSGVDAVGGGGGGGQGGVQTTGKNGGSGGGGRTTPPGARGPGGAAYGSGTIGSTLQGFSGGDSSTSSPVGGGGGGGAGGAGVPVDSVSFGLAGTGIGSPLSASIPGFFGTAGASPTLRYFAGGGGGGGGPGRSSGPGSIGGGGAGGRFTPGVPVDSVGASGNVNTGGGGGGGGGPEPGTFNGSGGSGIVVIRYPFVQTEEFTSATANSTAVTATANAFFVIRTNFANANTLFYDTIGNVTSESFVGGNTGSFIVTGNETVLRLQTTNTVPLNEERMFALRIRQAAANGSIRLTSQNVYVYDSTVSAFILATGGNVFTEGGFRTHIFTSSNNFTVTSAGKVGGNIEFFMVAGGGSGGAGGSGSLGGGGGGAGGVLFGTSTVVANTYVVTVGAGGTGYTTSGGNTSVIGATTIGPGVVAIGGGGGGGGTSVSPPRGPGRNGGSGGGAVTSSSDNPATAFWFGRGYGSGQFGTTLQGYPGGYTANSSSNSGGAGGGGAGGKGADFLSGGPAAAQSAASVGGIGISSPLSPSIPGFFGTSGPGAGRWFAGGGGGGGAFPSNAPDGPAGRVGGAGGGGKGGDAGPTSSPTNFNFAGNVNTGGGGGGLGTDNSTYPQSPYPTAANQGGSGIVIIRYPFA